MRRIKGAIPGYCDGDYPDWLQAQADQFVPTDLLETYGEEVTTTLNGSYWRIPAENIDELLIALKWRKYELTEKPDLNFR